MLETFKVLLEKTAELIMNPDPGSANQIKSPADSGWKNKKVIPKPGKPALKPKLLNKPPIVQPKPETEKKEPEQKPSQNPSSLELNLMQNKNRIEKTRNREQQMLNREQQQAIKKDKGDNPEDTADVGQDHLKKINDLDRKRHVIDTKLVNFQKSRKALSEVLKDIAQSIQGRSV